MIALDYGTVLHVHDYDQDDVTLTDPVMLPVAGDRDTTLAAHGYMPVGDWGTRIISRGPALRETCAVDVRKAGTR